MTRQNVIIKYGLTKRAIELRDEELSFDKIAIELSNESGYTITDSSVQRYFASRERITKEAVSKSVELQTKLAEGEINALESRKEIIDGLLEIAKNKDLKPIERVQAFKEANTAVDSYQKSMGKFAPDSVLNNNIILGSLEELTDTELEEIARDGPKK